MKKLIAFICIVLVILSLPSTAFAAKKDTKAPTVTKTNPQDKTGGIMIETSIVVRFSENVTKGKTIKDLSLTDGNGKAVKYTYEIKDNLLTITPKNDLQYSMAYSLLVPAMSVKDSAGNALKEDYKLNFITGENPAAEQKSADTAYQYDIGIEANLQGELTKGMQDYIVQYLKMFGIDAKIKKVERIKE
jgi:methionine-rich copper-binding protein CopC